AFAEGPRLIADRQWLWTFGSDLVRRYDLETFEADLDIDAKDIAGDGPAITVNDIAADGADGLWLLVGHNNSRYIARIASDACVYAGPKPVDPDKADQIGVLGRGKTLVVLSVTSRRLTFIDLAAETVARSVDVEQFAPGWSPDRLATDGRGLIGLG